MVIWAKVVSLTSQLCPEPVLHKFDKEVTFNLLPLNPITHHHFLAAGHFCPMHQFRAVANRWFKPHFHLIITDPSWKDLWARNTSFIFVKAICTYSTIGTRTQFSSVLNASHPPDRGGDRKHSPVCRTWFRGRRLCVPILNLLLFSVQVRVPQHLDRKKHNPGKKTENGRCPWHWFWFIFPCWN